MDAYMLRYLTGGEYRSISPEGEATQTEIYQAECEVDTLTFGRIVSTGFAKMTENQKRLIKRAVCLQADFLHEYGDTLSNPLSSYGINGVSMSWNKDSLVRQGAVWTTNGVYSLLQQTGLTYRGLDWRQ